MTQLTIEVSDELALRLQPVRNRMLDIIELGLRELQPASNPLANELIEFLSRAPSTEEILAFHPSIRSTTRIEDLLDKKRSSELIPDEEDELNQAEQLDFMMTLIKARTRQRSIQAK